MTVLPLVILGKISMEYSLCFRNNKIFLYNSSDVFFAFIQKVPYFCQGHHGGEVCIADRIGIKGLTH